MRDLPTAETMLNYASFLEKPKFDVRNGIKYPLPNGEATVAAIAALRFCAGMWVCTGCGSYKSIDQIRTEHPNAISCCPERKMRPYAAETIGIREGQS